MPEQGAHALPAVASTASMSTIAGRTANGAQAFSAPLVMPFMKARVNITKRMPRGSAEIT